MGLQLIHSDSGSIPNKRVVYSRNRITEPAWCLPSGSLATTEDGALVPHWSVLQHRGHGLTPALLLAQSCKAAA